VSGRVLVVDDEVEMQRALRTGLSYHDFDVRAVGSGEEAISEAAAWRPDVILLDLGLPGMDGLATLKALRPATRAAVIVISVMPEERDKVRALDAGADDSLTKPLTLILLAAIVVCAIPLALMRRRLTQRRRGRARPRTREAA